MMDRKISPASLESCKDPLKASKYFAVPDKLSDIFLVLIRIGILVSLIASVSLALHLAFSKPTRWFPLPDHLQERSCYSGLWWDPNTTRGFVWLDQKPKYDVSHFLVPYQISHDWRQFRHVHSDYAVRIARIVYESFKLGLPNVRWFVMGDDDTVFFPKNLVTVLGKYDHREMYYIGGNSESVEQDVMHAYGMAFGGGGFAISYALAAQLANIFDSCLHRYYYFYGSDQRVWACVSEIGVPLTKESGFHQLDIRGDPHGLLAAHPLAPLVSLHHLDHLQPLFSNQTHIDSMKTIIHAYHLDPYRIMQQTFCYDPKRRWSISISWGYVVQIYTSMLPAKDLQTPLQTFKTWRSYSDGPFTFNTRPMSSDPCKQPALFFLDKVQEVRSSGTVTSYKRFVHAEAKKCMAAGINPEEVERITVSALKLDPNYWKNVPRRQCCRVMDGGSIKDGSLRMRIRKCRTRETVTIRQL
ncbi:hypothetical protein L6164_032985 [Bauhinia variegata]|uniref:Uncharacterized protein n=1 Tax=Bauhinia variegata TaxID=167791 RepID=A0ACB9KQK1_BAUVA|nr:hypothetical protein L6164_032985 [Bauhinia variegata]